MSTKNKLSLFDSLLNMIERRKTSDRLLLRTFFFVVIISGIFFAYNLSTKHSSPTPTPGGTLKEGIVGIPRFANPALALTRADQDAVALIYSGLMKIDGAGNLVPDIAESITVGEDGKSYNIIMHRDKTFHDGAPLTSRDVEYTINLVQNGELKSPLAGNWSDVVVEVNNEYELMVTLPEAYSPFIENFTLGIMPHHIWSSLPVQQLPFSQHNTEPIGSGPFAIKEVVRDASGLISSYVLKPATETNLEAIELYFFQNETQLEEAFTAKKINATAYLPLNKIKSLSTDYQVVTSPLPRAFGIFFNQNRSTALRDAAARKALSESVDRTKLIDTILYGFGVPMTEPMLPLASALKSESKTPAEAFSLEAAKDTLIKGKWKQNEAGFWEKEIDGASEVLTVTIKTSNSELFNATASILKDSWRELGVDVEVEQYEQSDLVQSIIRPREFSALLFGLDMSRSKDLYPFWHSSQKSDPGLNISQYTNISIDRLLEKSRRTEDKTERLNLLSEISNTINEEIPAIFLFAPSLTYVQSGDIITTPFVELGKPADRFMSIEGWYAKTEVLWPIFQNKELNNNVN